MTSEHVVAIIPARWGSTRFPGKPLADINGTPMIHRVIHRACQADRVDDVFVATDDERIKESVDTTPAQAVMTSSDHESGSDRVAEVARDISPDIVVNVQGDEPLMPSDGLDRGIEALINDPGADVSTFVYSGEETEYHDPDRVKVVRGDDDRAIYFSRSPIPHVSDNNLPEEILIHVGIYIYRYQALVDFTESSRRLLERMEDLEQLRLIEQGYHYKAVEIDGSTVGVDRPEDIERVERRLDATEQDVS